MKRISILLTTLILGICVNATIILDEKFDYEDFATAEGWTTTGNFTGTGRTLGDKGLAYSNDGGTYILSEEGKVLQQEFLSGETTAYVSVKEFATVKTGNLYLSFLYKATIPQTQGGSEIFGMSNNTATPSVRAWASGKDTGGNPFKMGVLRAGGASGDVQWDSITQLIPNKVYLVVVKYDFTAKTASLFIDPVINSNIEPSPNRYDDSKSTARTSLNCLMFRNAGNNRAVFDVSGVRLSTTWAEAVAGKITAPKLSTPTAGIVTDAAENSFTANWSTVTNAIGYIVKLYKNNVEDGIYEVDGQETENLLIEGLFPATEYSYTVTAKGDQTNYSNSSASNVIPFATLQPTSYASVNTDFGDGSWGTALLSTPSTGTYPSSVVNGFQLQKAALITGSVPCPSGITHTNRIAVDKKDNGGAIELPPLKNVGGVEIHANAGTAGNPFNLEIWENDDWSIIGTYSTLKSKDSIYYIPVMKAEETKLRIANASGGGIYIFKILTRTYQEGQELNITGTTPADGTSCYYNLTKNIILTLNKDVELGTGSILLNETPVTLDESMIDGKIVTIPVTLESTTSGKSYTVTIPAGTFEEKGNQTNLSNLKEFSFTTVKTVAYPANYSSQIDVVYSTADAGRNRMDVYYPTGDGLRSSSPVPVVINIHGGGWNHGDKEAQGGFNIYFNMGFAVANMEYRLTSDATAPAAIEDARCAMMYLLKHADEFNIDPKKIIFQGGSAGAHIALTAAYLQKDARFDTGCNDYSGPYEIIVVIDKYGPTDMWALKDWYSSAANWLGDKKTDEEFVKSVSPAFMVNANTPPTYIIHGDQDPTIPYADSELLADKLEAQGIKYEFTTVPGGLHGGFPTEYNNRMNEEIVLFLNSILNNPTSINTEEVDSEVKISLINGILSIQADVKCSTSVYDVAGRKLLSSSKTEIQLPQAAKGVLLVKIEANKQTYIHKVIR